VLLKNASNLSDYQQEELQSTWTPMDQTGILMHWIDETHQARMCAYLSATRIF